MVSPLAPFTSNAYLSPFPVIVEKRCSDIDITLSSSPKMAAFILERNGARIQYWKSSFPQDGIGITSLWFIRSKTSVECPNLVEIPIYGGRYDFGLTDPEGGS